MAAEFHIPGTRDPSPWLTAPFAIELLREFGLDAVFAHNHDLACSAGQQVSDTWGTPFATPTDMLGAMVSVVLPTRLDNTPAAAKRYQAALAESALSTP